MKRLAVALIALAACEQPRTEIMFGVVTDIRAPNLIDNARLVVTRAKDGFVQQDISWELSGVPNQPFNLPGSYGVYSDGEEVKLDVVLTGMKGPNDVLNRRAVMNLVEGKTLFFRMSLVAGCQDRTDCLATQSCVEGVCRDVNIVSEQLPDFEPLLVDHLTCDSGTKFIDTATGASLPMAPGAEDCPASLCVDGTCLKPPPPPESGSRPVTGYKYTNYVEATKTTNVAENLSTTGIAAMIPQTDGSFTTIQGRGNPDGTFVIDSVPNGEYYLRVGTEYFVTTSDSFDLTRAVAGRPNQTPASAGTGMTLQSATNLGAWVSTDQLEMFAPGADTWWFGLQGTTPPGAGATSLSNYTITSADAAGNGPPNLIVNDPVGISQLQSKTDPGTSLVYQAQTKFAQLPAFTQVGGQTSLINPFAFQDTPQTSMVDAPFSAALWDSMLGWDGTHLSALHPAAGHYTAGDGYGLYAHAQVGGALYGQFSATQDFMYVNLPHNQDSQLAGLTFGTTTLPGSWASMLTVDVFARVLYTVPGITQPVAEGVGIRQNTLLSTLTKDFFAPNLGPIRTPRLDGRDLFQQQRGGVSTTPTITWQTPSVGNPSMYKLLISELGQAGAATGKTAVATLYTTATSILIPGGVLQIGRSYIMQITAMTVPNPAAPFRQRLPSAQSSIATEPFVPDTEGGKTIDPGPQPVGDAGTGSGGGGPIDAGSMTCMPGGPQCYNCVDDDLDGKLDLQDPECLSQGDNSESVP